MQSHPAKLRVKIRCFSRFLRSDTIKWYDVSQRFCAATVRKIRAWIFSDKLL